MIHSEWMFMWECRCYFAIKKHTNFSAWSWPKPTVFIWWLQISSITASKIAFTSRRPNIPNISTGQSLFDELIFLIIGEYVMNMWNSEKERVLNQIHICIIIRTITITIVIITFDCSIAQNSLVAFLVKLHPCNVYGKCFGRRASQPLDCASAHVPSWRNMNGLHHEHLYTWSV